MPTVGSDGERGSGCQGTLTLPSVGLEPTEGHFHLMRTFDESKPGPRRSTGVDDGWTRGLVQTAQYPTLFDDSLTT